MAAPPIESASNSRTMIAYAGSRGSIVSSTQAFVSHDRSRVALPALTIIANGVVRLLTLLCGREDGRRWSNE